MIRPHIRSFLRRLRPPTIIDRNQWRQSSPESAQAYLEVMSRSWEEMREKNPQYFARLSASVSQARGRVLELGAGCGNVTKWLVQRPEVSSVVAVEGFTEGLTMLEALRLPKVECRQQRVESLSFPPGERFDTVLVLELIEHLYPAEELAMLSAVRPHLAKEAGYVVSTPIGFMPDPYHIRGFDKAELLTHLEKHYGLVGGVDYTAGYSQVAWGTWTPRSTSPADSGAS